MWGRLLVLAVALGVAAPLAAATALDDYVNRPDPTYSYTVLEVSV